jgi:hypothetical protein
MRGAWAESTSRVEIGALKLYIRDPSAPSLTWRGDQELAHALAGVKAILG